MAHGEINHIEFPADDTERAKTLYGTVGKRDVSTGHIVRAYITVDSIDDALAASDRNGGTAKEPKSEVQRMGWFAVVIDPEGSEVGLFQGTPAS